MKVDDIYKRAIDDIRRIIIKVERLESLYQAIDIVPVVRCKDCTHYDNGLCRRWKWSHVTNEDSFCSDAERKE